MSGALSAEHKAKLRAAKLGRKHTPQHNARIAEAMRRSWVETGHRDIFTSMSIEEHGNYRILRGKGGFSRTEALRAIQREDLIDAHKSVT